MPSARRLPPRKKRSQCFLGIHFDFHAGDDCTEVGKNVTPRMVERIVTSVRPDFIQCDCKGHRGLCSYLTKVGHRAPGFVRDPLRIWRQVTAKHGIPLYVHYSGVWDTEAVRRHPSWARLDENGKRDKDKISLFGPYVDRLLIPQLKELSDEYDIDGAWVDGECWAVAPDYSKRALAAFRRETGIATVPRKPSDPHYADFLEFCREAFRRYLRHYVDEIHKHNPNFQITSNWAFSSFMPEPVTADLDFLSGDFSMQDSVNAARYEGRCLASQGKPWDLMAWSFSGRWEDRARSTKTPAQLQQEAACVLALGGGFQAYFTQKRDASISEWQMRLMAETAKFCRAREPFCHKAEPVPQVALLYSTTAFYAQSKQLFGGDVPHLRGILNALLDCQYSVQVLSEHHLSGRMQRYPCIVVPEWEHLEKDFVRELLDYAAQGGSLLVIGPKAVALLEQPLPLRLTGEPAEQIRWLGYGDWLAGLSTLCQSAVLRPGAEPVGTLHRENDLASPSEPAAALARHGKGRIAVVFTNLGERYRKARVPVIRDFLGALLRRLFPRPLVQISGSRSLDLQVNRINGKLAVNLINTAGPHHDPSIYVYDEIPGLGPLTLTIRLPRKPRAIVRQPAGENLPFDFDRGKARLVLPKLEIHEVLLVEE